MKQERSWFYIGYICMLCMIAMLFSGCSFSFEACSDDKIKEYTVAYLKTQGYSTVADLDKFTLISNQVLKNKKEQTVTFSCEFLDDTVRYQRKYEMVLLHDKKWIVKDIKPYEQASWQDVAVAGVSMAQALDDIDGYRYESNFSDGIIKTAKITSAIVKEQWEDLPKQKSGISIGFSVKNGGAVEEFVFLGEYEYKPGKGWILVSQNVEITPIITEVISDEIMLNAVSMLQIEHEGEQYLFSDMKKTYYDIKNLTVNSQDCEANVEFFVHGETDLLYVSFTASCILRYSDGWYFYRVDSYHDDVKIGYINDTCMVTEKVVLEELKQRDFKYGFAKDIPMKDLEIHDFQIVSHRISEKGYRQEVSYTYYLTFDYATIHVRGNAVFLYENNALSRYSMNGETTDVSINLNGKWQGTLPLDGYVRDLTLELKSDPFDQTIVSGTVTFIDRPGTMNDSDNEETESAKADEESTFSVDTSEIMERSSERFGSYIVKGICDSTRYMRISLVFVAWLNACDNAQMIELTGYYDCGTNEIVLDNYPDNPLLFVTPIE